MVRTPVVGWMVAMWCVDSFVVVVIVVAYHYSGVRWWCCEWWEVVLQVFPDAVGRAEERRGSSVRVEKESQPNAGGRGSGVLELFDCFEVTGSPFQVSGCSFGGAPLLCPCCLRML